MSLFFRKKRKKNKVIDFDADKALIDSKNLANFDEGRLEGVLEKPLEKINIWGFFTAFLLLTIFLLYKAYDMQILNKEIYQKKAEANYSRVSVIFSERGVIFDRNGVELAWNEEKEDEEFSKRKYIDSEGFSHLLGFLSYPQKDKTGVFYEKEYIGKAGIEKYFNDRLNGYLGKRYIIVNSSGKIISDNLINEQKPGENIYLSIDSKVQEIMYKNLKKYLEEKGFNGGAAAMMNIETGEIISMVSYPEYSSSVMTEVKDKEKIKSYFQDKRNPFLNKVTFGLYTPGSIIKPFVALAALDQDFINPKKKVYTNGELIIPNPYFPDKPTIFKDWKNHGSVDMYDAIANSSNVYFYLLAGGYPPEGKKGLGIEIIKKYLTDFGFGQKTGIDYFIEKSGVVPNPEWKKKAFKDARPWNIGNTYFTAIGQYGFLITPIQALTAVSAIANNGKLIKPVIEKGKNGEIKKIINIDEKNFQIVRDAMREAVLRGTNRALNLPFVKIASKSGTAQVKGKERSNSWTIGFFPYENPKYAFVFLASDGPTKLEQSVALAAYWFFLEMKEKGLDDYFIND